MQQFRESVKRSSEYSAKTAGGRWLSERFLNAARINGYIHFIKRNHVFNVELLNFGKSLKGWNISQLYNGYMLPNARDISTHIITTERITSDDRYSLMLMQWGQFVDRKFIFLSKFDNLIHNFWNLTKKDDLGHTVMAMSLNRFSNGIACRDSCTNDQPCFPIQVMANDTLRTHLPGKCMEFVRSSAVCGTGETSLITNKIYQREQINQLTAFIDASNVYGRLDSLKFRMRKILK